jgi:hypothetical protein
MIAMPLDLSGSDINQSKNRLTSGNAGRHTDLYAQAADLITAAQTAYSPDDTAIVAPLLDIGGYLACGCHGSQREHTCTHND